tara:strand:- start:67896 stop:68897 length:1002 start_codon:yes stop_codon:yes gene_type:complete
MTAIADLKSPIEDALLDACQFGEGCPARLGEAIRYAVLSPGKRLRPCLVLMAAEACGGSFEQAMPGAVAVELIHAYSLIHDDLPAMDDDDLRRGRPTVHVAFDEATAILAGDALQPMAMEHLATHVRNAEQAVAAIAALAKAAGPTELVGGQSDDLAAERQHNDPDPEMPRPPGANATDETTMHVSGDAGITATESGAATPCEQTTRSLAHLEAIHRRKTGALFAVSLELGAILSEGSDEARLALGNYARELGLGFQVADDLLDHTAGEAELGKRTGKDASRGKLTFPALMGVEASRLRVEELVASARRHASFFGDAAWRLNWLAEYVLERSR